MTYSSFDPTKPKKPLRAMSSKREARIKDREATIAATRKRAGNQCESADLLPQITCTPWLQDTHEVLSRGRGGSPYDPANTILACRAHHTWITEHPTQSEELGLLLPSQPTKRLLYDRRADAS